MSERPKWRALYQERAKEQDFHICPRCGAEFNRLSEWQMLEALPEHNWRHEQEENI